MKTSLSYISVIALSAMFFFNDPISAQEESPTSISERALPAFNSVKAGGSYKIYIEQGSTQQVSVEAPQNIQDKIITEVKGNTLNISNKSNMSGGSVKIHIVCVSLESIELSNITECYNDKPISTSNFKLTQSGISKAKMNLEAGSLEIKMSGATQAQIIGAGEKMTLDLSGAAKLDASGFLNTETLINIDGAASATINTKESVRGKISGASLLAYENIPAQEDINRSGVSDIKTKSKDTTYFMLGKQKIIIVEGSEKNNKKESKKKSKFNGHWGGFELGVNSYFNPKNGTSMPQEYNFLKLNQAKSVAVNLNLWEQNFNLYKNKVGLTTGLGLTFNNYRLDKNVLLVGDSLKISGIKDSEFSYVKSKLSINYLTLPLILEYQTNNKSNKHSFHIGGGVEGGLRIGSHNKIVYNNGGKQKIKNNDDFHLNPFKLDATARLGWGSINLFGKYSLSRLFNNGEGYELYPFTAGMVIIGW